jgi:hypothetical protein
MLHVLVSAAFLLACAGFLAGCASPRAPLNERSEVLTWSGGEGRLAPVEGEEDEERPELLVQSVAPPTDAPTSPLDADRTTDLCRDPLLQPIREALPDIPLCDRGVPARFATVVHGTRQATVVGYRDDRPTWVDGHARYGSAVLINGAPLPDARARKFWDRLGDLAQLPQPEIPNLLQGILLQQGVFEQIATLEQAEEALAGWGAGLEAVRAHPPGMSTETAAHHVRIWRHRAVAGMGVSCRHLERHELALTRDGRVVIHPTQQWATGQRMGQPCGESL